MERRLATNCSVVMVTTESKVVEAVTNSSVATGSDYFVWVAGDGSDLMEGGTGETDQLIFIANDASNLLQVYGGGLFSDRPRRILPRLRHSTTAPERSLNSTRAKCS